MVYLAVFDLWKIFYFNLQYKQKDVEYRIWLKYIHET